MFLLSFADFSLTMWITAILLFSILTFSMIWRKFFRGKADTKAKVEPRVVHQLIARVLSQTLPLHPNSGWIFKEMSQGVRLFSRQFSFQTPHLLHSDGEVYAASLIVDLTLKRALSLVSSLKELPCWNPGLDLPSLQKVKLPSPNSHAIQLTVRDSAKGPVKRAIWLIRSKVAGWTEKYVPFFESLVSAPLKIRTETMERYLYAEEGMGYLFSWPRQPSSLPYLWSCLFFSSLNQPGVSVATMVMFPKPAEEVAHVITGQLCALREHVTMRNFKAYSLQLPRLAGNEDPVVSTVESPKQVDSEVKNSTSSLELSAAPVPSSISTPALANLESSKSEVDIKYLNMADECSNRLTAMVEEGVSEGWVDIGTKKNICVMKKLPDANGPPLNSVKGTGTICAPPEFLLHILLDPVLSTKLDALLKEARLIQKISPAVTLVHLLYKAIWPTSPRDFCLLSIAGQVDSCTWISSGMSVVDSRIPEQKDHVRGNLMSGGYIIQSIPNSPETSRVTYSACVDLKGNIPAIAVNKVTESQPLCVDQLRRLAEPLYRELKADPQKMAALVEGHVIAPISPKNEEFRAKATTMAAEVAFPDPLVNRLVDSQWHFDPSSLDAPQSDSLDNGDAVQNVERQSRFSTPPGTPPPSEGDQDQVDHPRASDLTENSAAPSLLQEPIQTEDASISSAHSTPNLHIRPKYSNGPLKAAAQSSPDFHHQSITKENISYPRQDSGEVDFRTLANQMAARLLEEVFHIGTFNVSDPSTFTYQSGGWRFIGLEKEVLLLSKSSEDIPFTSFVGKGVIPLAPQVVFDCLRNPQHRFIYDNMLKELRIVRQIEEGLCILHLHHETTQCFVRQARDFCILIGERSEPNKKLLVGTSIETPECPPSSRLQRGRIFCSGWVVEPKLSQGNLHTELTYLLQVDIGGISSSLVNLISKRQPLAIAYLRDYLTSTSLNSETKKDATIS